MLHIGEEQLALDSKPFQLEGARGRRATADAFLRLLLRSLLLLLLLLHLLQWLLRFRCLGNGRQRVKCCFLFSPFSLAPISPFLPLRPVLSRALPARLLWLLATPFDGLSPSAGEVHCPYGPTKRLCHQVMCLFDTWLSSCIEFVSFFTSTQFSCVVISSSPSCPSWAWTSLSSLRSS